MKRPPRKEAQFITPPNVLKAKVGKGGLADDVLERADRIIEENKVDFGPMLEDYLAKLAAFIDQATNESYDGKESEFIDRMCYPVMEMKANGSMFHAPIISDVANQLLQFLEIVPSLDKDSLEIVNAFYATLNALHKAKIRRSDDVRGIELVTALREACLRYMEKKGL